MFPLLAGAITFVLLALYCWWIGDEWEEEKAADGCRPSHELQEEDPIPIANWPISAGRDRRENV